MLGLTRIKGTNRLLQVILVAMSVLIFGGCRELVDSQTSEEKLRCTQKCLTNKCSSIFSTQSCKENCVLDCGCSYNYPNGIYLQRRLEKPRILQNITIISKSAIIL